MQVTQWCNTGAQGDAIRAADVGVPVGEVVARTSSSWMDGADVGMEGESILQRRRRSAGASERPCRYITVRVTCRLSS